MEKIAFGCFFLVWYTVQPRAFCDLCASEVTVCFFFFGFDERNLRIFFGKFRTSECFFENGNLFFLYVRCGQCIRFKYFFFIALFQGLFFFLRKFFCWKKGEIMSLFFCII